MPPIKGASSDEHDINLRYFLRPVLWRLQQPDSSEITALIAAVIGDSLDEVGETVAAETDPNRRLGDGSTALHFAAARNVTYLTVLLTTYGADPNSQDKLGVRPIHVAAFGGHGKVIHALHELGGELDPRDADGNTPLWYACRQGHALAAATLLVLGADPNARCDGGFTPLCSAAYSEDCDTIRFLCQHGADVNARLADGNTALHIAAGLGLTQSVEVLLQQGAKPEIANGSGYDVETYARLAKQPRVADLIRKRGRADVGASFAQKFGCATFLALGSVTLPVFWWLRAR